MCFASAKRKVHLFFNLEKLNLWQSARNKFYICNSIKFTSFSGFCTFLSKHICWNRGIGSFLIGRLGEWTIITKKSLFYLKYFFHKCLNTLAWLIILFAKWIQNIQFFKVISGFERLGNERWEHAHSSGSVGSSHWLRAKKRSLQSFGNPQIFPVSWLPSVQVSSNLHHSFQSSRTINYEAFLYSISHFLFHFFISHFFFLTFSSLPLPTRPLWRQIEFSELNHSINSL